MSEAPRRFKPGAAPLQYPLGDVCTCGARLSRYNPYVVCGPCRVRIASDITDDFVEDDDTAAHTPYVWERFDKRRAVRRGSLLEAES